MSTKKSIWKIIEEMNNDDEVNKSRLCQVSTTMVACRKVSQGAIVEMGVEESTLYEIMADNVMVFLVVLDKREFGKRNAPTEKQILNQSLHDAAKRKAKQMVLSMKRYAYCYMGSGMLTNTYDIDVAVACAKKLAYLAVDEVFESAQILGVEPTRPLEFWNRVKEEISLIDSNNLEL